MIAWIILAILFIILVILFTAFILYINSDNGIDYYKNSSKIDNEIKTLETEIN